MVEFLLQKGQNLNVRSQDGKFETALSMGVRLNECQLVRLLLEQGAMANV